MQMSRELVSSLLAVLAASSATSCGPQKPNEAVTSAGKASAIQAQTRNLRVLINQSTELKKRIEAGDTSEAWRVAVDLLASSGDSELSQAGYLLAVLHQHEPGCRTVIEALVEGRLTHSEDLDAFEKAGLFRWIAVWQGIAVDPAASSESARAVGECLKAKQLTQNARVLGENLMKGSRLETKLAAAPILFSASNSGEADRQWAVNLCHQQLHSRQGPPGTVTRVLFEGVANQFIPSESKK